MVSSLRGVRIRDSFKIFYKIPLLFKDKLLNNLILYKNKNMLLPINDKKMITSLVLAVIMVILVGSIISFIGSNKIKNNNQINNIEFIEIL